MRPLCRSPSLRCNMSEHVRLHKGHRRKNRIKNCALSDYNDTDRCLPNACPCGVPSIPRELSLGGPKTPPASCPMEAYAPNTFRSTQQGWASEGNPCDWKLCFAALSGNTASPTTWPKIQRSASSLHPSTYPLGAGWEIFCRTRRDPCGKLAPEDGWIERGGSTF